MTQYQTIYSVIRDNGDGSQSIKWRKTWPDGLYELLENDESYQSGDGVQWKDWKFPLDFDIDAWAKINYVAWMENDE